MKKSRRLPILGRGTLGGIQTSDSTLGLKEEKEEKTKTVDKLIENEQCRNDKEGAPKPI